MRRALAIVAVVLLALAVGGQGFSPVPAGQGPNPAQDFVWPGEQEMLPAPAADAVASLGADRLAAHIAFLSAPALGGRGLGDEGLEAAIEYVAAQLSLAGVVPALTASGAQPLEAYYQPVTLRAVSRPGGRLTISRGSGAGAVQTVFRRGADAWFPEVPPRTLQGAAVFAGYGIREKHPARDDYKGLDVKGKIVVLLGGLPEGAQWQTPELRARYDAEGARARYAAKAGLAGSLGARAIVAIEDDGFAAALAKDAATPAPSFFVLAEADPAQLPPVVRVTPRVGDELLAAASLSTAAARKGAPRNLPETRLQIATTGRERVVTSRNVIAMVPGAHPVLRDEAIVIGAHVDHLGRRGAVHYPGADDNASGVAAVLEMARAFAAGRQKPSRTLVFAFWTGEEEGHLGAEYYCRHPAWPLDRTAVYLNLDMIGHPWLRHEIEKLVADTGLERGGEFLSAVDPARFIELGLAEWAEEVAPVLKSAARGVGLALRLDRTDGKTGGSDYREFAWRGVRFVRFFGNYFDGYHEPADRVETLDREQVLRVARLALASAWLLADR